MDYKNLISCKKSIRDYKKSSLKSEQINELLEYVRICKRLNSNIDVEALIKDKEVFNQLNGIAGYNGFMIEAPNYLILLSEQKDNYIENAGYIGEDICLKALDINIGSCWITFKDSDTIKGKLGIASEKAVVALIALGFDNNKAKPINVPKVGANESKTQLDLVEDNKAYRLAVEDVVYLKKWGNKAKPSDLSMRALLDAFHYARLAPSSLNRQPWRFILDDDVVVLAVRADENVNSYDEKIDAGIVMLYFEAIVDSTLADVTWVMKAPQKQYNIPDEYKIVGYCNI